MMDERCENMATIRRHWPGKQPDLVCVDHAQDSEKVADAMGFSVTLEPIGYRVGEMPEEFVCCCSKGFSQSVTIEENSCTH